MSDPKRIHMIAICGTGMAALAGLLKKAGHAVTGSDTQIYPPMSTLLEAAGIPCKVGYDPAHIESTTDLVIIGNAVGKTNPEVLAVQERGIPYFSMAAALGDFFLKGKKPLVVTETHGKTTTSSLLAWVLASAGIDPGMMIGGWVKNFNSNHRLGKGDFFVVEGDEYDTAFFDKGPKFLHYRPYHAILTSIEFDHGDIYLDLAAIKQAFRRFVELLPKEGLLVVAAGDPAIAEVTKGIACRVETYGIGAPADGFRSTSGLRSYLQPFPGGHNHSQGGHWQADRLEMIGERLSFQVSYQGKMLGTIRSPLLGRHNAMNTLAVIALAHQTGLSWEAISEGIARFEGVKRRQEIVGSVGDVLVIDDFAHHPTAITETLAALRLRYPRRRLWAVFEPRSATSRRNVFQKEFAASFASADGVVVADLFAPEKIPAEHRLDPRRIVTDLTADGKPAWSLSTPDQIVDLLLDQVAPGDLVCVMSSGGFGGIHGKLIAGLEKKHRH